MQNPTIKYEYMPKGTKYCMTKHDVEIPVRYILKDKNWICELDSATSGQIPMAGFCEHDNESSSSLTKLGNFKFLK
jgi:hypothetical protein